MPPPSPVQRLASRESASASNGSRKLTRDRVLEDLLVGTGYPLATAELAQMIGMSATFVRDEIRSGHLRAVLIGRGRKRVYRIHVREALRYARSLGFL